MTTPGPASPAPAAPPRDESPWALAAARARAPMAVAGAGHPAGGAVEAEPIPLIDADTAAAAALPRLGADTGSLPQPTGPRVRKPTWRFMLAHPAHVLGLGFGSGLSPWAPGTMGTLWAWLVFRLLQPHLADAAWAGLIAASLAVGWWACTVTARNMAVADPGAVVWDEIVAFWIVLWLSGPTTPWGEAWAFALFRFFDAAKPGPVAWADALFKVQRGRPIGWAQGFGILFDDLVAALCALLVIAVGRMW